MVGMVNPRPPLCPQGVLRRVPMRPEGMTSDVTEPENYFVLAHLGIPQIDPARWSVAVDGLVRKPLRLSMSDLRKYPQKRVTAVHQCAGNPLQPTIPARRVMNVVWGGVALDEILFAAGLRDEAKYIWAYGADYGVFEGHACDHYLKDIPVDRIPAGDILLAYEINGAALPAENGYPVRLVVPGFYGTNSVKWLYRLTAASTRADGVFTTRFYNDSQDGGSRSAGKPVWQVAPESLIVRPRPDAEARLGDEVEVMGRAWTGARQPIAIDFSADGGTSWREIVSYRAPSWSWHGFRTVWRPEFRGQVELAVRVRSLDGQVQPSDGARNAVHKVLVNVV